MYSRQVTRAMERAIKKDAKRQQRALARRAAARALRERQSIRTENGFYTASVFNFMTGTRSTPIDQRKIRKGKPFGRTLHSLVVDGVEISYHATKGWRRHAA